MTEPTDPIDAIRAITRRPIEPDFTSSRELIDRGPAPVIDIPSPARRHAEDAAAMLGTIEERAQHDGHPISDSALATMAVAEATLALAAQQRIANLIAWEDLTRESNRATVRRELEP